MVWRDVLENNNIEFREGAKHNEIEKAEGVLGLSLQNELKELLFQSNGLVDEFKSDFIWRISKIVSENLYFRSSPDLKELYMNFDSILFFADAGNGDHFGIRMYGDKILSTDIYVWNHEDDSRNWVSSNLEEFIKGWIVGNIST